MSKEIFNLNEENVILKQELKSFRLMIDNYKHCIQIVKNIFQQLKFLSLFSIKNIPSFSDTSIDSVKESLENIFLYVSNTKTAEVKDSEVLILNDSANYSEKTGNFVTPEPEESYVIRNQHRSIVKSEKVIRSHNSKIPNRKSPVKIHLLAENILFKKHFNIKSVSPILKSRYKKSLNSK